MAFERVRVAGLAVALLFTLEGIALADPSAAEKETARGLMADGRQRRGDNDLLSALRSFEAADAIMHVPTTGLEVARTQVALGRLVEGRDTLRRVLVLPSRPDEPIPFQEARSAAEKLDAELNDRIPTVKFVVRGAPTTPSLMVDAIRVPVEAMGAPFRVNPGRHEVTARAGSANVAKHVEVRERDVAEVVLDFGASVPSPVAPPDPVQLSADAPKPSSGAGMFTYVGFATASAGIVVGAVSGLLAVGSKNAAKSKCIDGRCPPETWDDIDRAGTFATVSTVAFVVGGVGVGVGVVSFLVTSDSRPSPAASSRTSVEPWVGAGRVGLRGTF